MSERGKMKKVRTQFLDEQFRLMTDLGDIAKIESRAECVCKLLKKNFPLNTFEVHKNDYNGGYNIHSDENSLFKIYDFRGFMRAVVVVKNWLEE